MNSRRILIVLACGAFLLAGCGLKGPLYLPDKQQSVPGKEKKEGDQKDQKKESSTSEPGSTPPSSGAANSDSKK
jgi:predicted small lipoprotein YifL